MFQAKIINRNGKMNKLILSSIILLMLTACGDGTDKKSSENKPESAEVVNKEIQACDYLTDDYVNNAFPSVTDVVQSELISEGKTCGYNFKINNKKHGLVLTIYGTGIPKIKDDDLDHYIKYLKGSVLISGVGERAYFTKSMPVLTANSKHTIIQVGASNLEWSKKVTNDMLAAIDK